MSEEFTKHKEELALNLDNSRTALLKELRENLICMNKEGQKVFKGYTFDFENKRLVSPCKKYALQWMIRLEPNKPESPKNQQTTSGTIKVIEL